MRLDWLADALRDEGCQVLEHTGWSVRSAEPFDSFNPEGLVNHHTAGSAVLTSYPNPPYYRNSALEMKCNLTIRGDGTCITLNAGWAHDSGFGDRRVLAAVRMDAPRPEPTDTYKSQSPIVVPGGSNPGVLGNAFFIDIEVQHLGNGDPIAPPQRDALIRANAAICRHLGWDPMTRLIGHREWSSRKQDPKWDGSANPMPKIRTDTQARLAAPSKEDDLLPLKKGEVREDVRLLQLRLNKGFDAGLVLSGTYDAATVTAVKTHLTRFTSAANLQNGEIVVSTMWEGLEDRLRSLAGGDGTDEIARAKAEQAHLRLDKLHQV